MNTPRRKFPFDIKPVDKDLNEQLLRDFHGEKTGFCQVGPKKWLLPAAYEKHAEDYYNVELKKDDVFIVTFPRSGTTVCQELIWIINNNLDYESAARISLQERFPFLEINTLFHDDFAREVIDLNKDPTVTSTIMSWKKPGQDFLAETPSPRHVKTHLPFSLLPPNLLDECKSIYVARNPKDVAVSYFHHNQHVRLHDYVNDFSQYWEYFKNDQVVFAPFWHHVEEGWSRRHHPNLLFLYYEDMMKDLPKAVTKVAEFFGKTLSVEQVQRLADHLKIENFRKNVPLMTNYPMKGFVNDKAEGFIRKGQVGGNKKEWADQNMEREANQWVSENAKKFGLEGFPLVS